MNEKDNMTSVCHVSRYSIMAFVLGLIVGGACLYAYGRDDYQRGFSDAKNIALNSIFGEMIPSEAEDIRVLSGVVVGVKEGSVTLKADQINPFEDPKLRERVVKIAPDTKITKKDFGDMEAYMAEEEAFMKELEKNSGTTAEPPIPPEINIVSGAFSDIKVDNVIVVIAVDNIATAKSFTASEIQIQ